MSNDDLDDEGYPRMLTDTELKQQQGFMPAGTYDVQLTDVKVTDREVVQVFQTEHGHQFMHRIKLPITGAAAAALDTDERPPTQNKQRRARWVSYLRAVPNLHASLGRDPEHQQELALAEHLAEHSEPPGPPTPEAVREVLRGREERCCDSCPGWGIFDSDTYGLHIATCDECVHGNNLPLFDEDVGRLPEAQLALAADVAKRIRQSFLSSLNRRLPPTLRLEVEVRGNNDIEISTRGGESMFKGPALEAVAAIEGMAAMVLLLTRK